MYEPIRGGTRGGQAEFKWSDVSQDKDREHYLGHSINAPTGRWQKNKDVHWYNRDLDQSEAERLEEIRKVKELEAEALGAALGYEPIEPKAKGDPPASSANNIPLAVKPGVLAAEKAAKEERKRLRAEHREEKRRRKEEKKSRKRVHGDDDEYEHRKHRHRSRSRSPRRPNPHPPRRPRSPDRPLKDVSPYPSESRRRRSPDRYEDRERGTSRREFSPGRR